MLKCPHCKRKIGEPTPGVEFRMPEHENYAKTAKCPGSGQTFVNGGGDYVRPAFSGRSPYESRPLSRAGRDARLAVLSLLIDRMG